MDVTVQRKEPQVVDIGIVMLAPRMKHHGMEVDVRAKAVAWKIVHLLLVYNTARHIEKVADIVVY